MGEVKRKMIGGMSREDFIKTLIIAINFFVIFFCYTMLKELKDSVFILIVGQKYIPDAKYISSFIMIPLIFVYSWIAGRLKKYWLLIIYALFYGIGGLICAWVLHDPAIGLANAIPSPHRLFGWIYYLFMDSLNPFFVSVLWAFFNSVSTPQEVKTKYMIMTGATKFAGICSAAFSWAFMSHYFTCFGTISDINSYVILLVIASSTILLVPLIMAALVSFVPASLLEGYTPVHEKEVQEKSKKKGIIEGFSLLFRYPYTLGIFGMIFFWEVVNVIFNYMRLGIGLKEATSIAGFSAFLYKNILFAHMIGFILLLCGTTPIVRFFGERISLLLIPLTTGGAIFFCMLYENASVIVFTYVFIQAINYAFSYPLREALYIPTTNNIKFQTKSWIDSFGSRFSKSVGSLYNKGAQYIPASLTHSFQSMFFCSIIFFWLLLAFFMGKTWERTIKQNKVVGN